MLDQMEVLKKGFGIPVNSESQRSSLEEQKVKDQFSTFVRQSDPTFVTLHWRKQELLDQLDVMVNNSYDYPH